MRALRSTAVICTVALLVFAVRENTFRWSQLSSVVTHYRSLFAVIFLALLAWELRVRPAPPGDHPAAPSA